MGLPWTPEELASAMALRSTHNCREIGLKIGRSGDEVRRKFNVERERLAGVHQKNPVASQIMRQLGPVPIPQEVLFDRERRLMAPDTPNTLVLGDPKTPRWHSNAAR